MKLTTKMESKIILLIYTLIEIQLAYTDRSKAKVQNSTMIQKSSGNPAGGGRLSIKSRSPPTDMKGGRQDGRGVPIAGGSAISSGPSLNIICQVLQISKDQCGCVQKGTCDNNNTDSNTVNGENQTFGNSASCQKPTLWWIEIYGNIVISLVGILSNLLCLLVTHIKDVKTTCRQLILILTLTDLIFSVLQLVHILPSVWSCGAWVYGQAGCKVIYPAVNTSTIVALGLILIVSIERYHGIVKPFKEHSSQRKIYIMAVLDLVFSLIFAVPAAIVLRIEKSEYSGIDLCVEFWSDQKYSLIYSWGLLGVAFIVPVSAITYFYMQIVKSLHETQKHVQNTFNSVEQTRRKKEDDRIKTIIAWLLVSFVLLVSPNRIWWVLHDHGLFDPLPRETRMCIKMVSDTAYCFHACTNPIIYTFVDKKFRRNLKAVCYGVFRVKSPKHSRETGTELQSTSQNCTTSMSIKRNFNDKITL